MEGPFYVHLADPQYAAHPRRPGNEEFPFGRRLGPFLTREEAVAQAVSDLAGGHLRAEDALGVYEDEESEKTRDGSRARAAIPPSRLLALANSERNRQEKERQQRVADTHPDHAAAWDALEAHLSPELRDDLLWLRERHTSSAPPPDPLEEA